jgi:hypothetical protein
MLAAQGFPRSPADRLLVKPAADIARILRLTIDSACGQDHGAAYRRRNRCRDRHPAVPLFPSLSPFSDSASGMSNQ